MLFRSSDEHPPSGVNYERDETYQTNTRDFGREQAKLEHHLAVGNGGHRWGEEWGGGPIARGSALPPAEARENSEHSLDGRLENGHLALDLGIDRLGETEGEGVSGEAARRAGFPNVLSARDGRRDNRDRALHAWSAACETSRPS